MSESENRAREVKAKVDELRERLSSDPQLREAITADPKPVLERELGISFPPELDNEALRGALPTFFSIEEAPGDELSDQQLESVAGGGCWDWKTYCYCYDPF